MRAVLRVCTALAVLGLSPYVLAHGGGHDGGAAETDMESSGHGHGHGSDMGADQPKPEDEYLPTYFALADHAGVMYAHIGAMVVAWVLLIPMAVVLSLARSRHTLLVQLASLAVNTLGVFLGVAYNANTPDLYPNNAHHKVGWVTAAAVTIHVVISLSAHLAGVFRFGPAQSDVHGAAEYRAFLPISAASMAERYRLHGSEYAPFPYRFSNDSGHGTEPNTESLRSHSASWSDQDSPRLSSEGHKEYVDRRDDNELEDGPAMPMPSETKPASNILTRLCGRISSPAWKVMMLAYNVVDRVILMLGFIALCLGIVTYGRFFEGNSIYSGLAHWIKGGVFFWLGIFTLGRWTGSFGELGWAWNVRPKRTDGKWRPSAEFVESFLIFFYGATNIFLEHLGNSARNKGWNATDLEHVSITVLFIGGGLLGMLVESTSVRDLLNTTVSESVVAAAEDHPYAANSRNSDQEQGTRDDDQPRKPEQYEFSINPIPALVILLLGIMMSSHTQQSMISSMVHKQWGNLLTGASFARGFTYVLLYLRPPRSVFPSRPPTELLAAFGLISGGVIFMASSTDTVEGMIHYELDAMFMYTVTMGLVGLLMAWIVIVLAVKGWAVRKEAARPGP